MTSHIHNLLSNEIITFPELSNKILTTIASDKNDDGSIIYKFNEHGYRSNSFNDLSNFNILTLGCSWTMGVGVNETQSWPYIIGEQFKTPATLFNYGMYGVSVSFIAKNFYKIVASGHIPNLCLIMWPGFSRRDYLTATGEFRKIGGFRKAHSKDPVWQNKPEDLLYLELQNDNQDLLTFWEAYKFVQVTAKLFNVQTFHTVAGYYFDIFKTQAMITNIVDSNTFFYPDNCYKNDKLGRDKEHPGPVWHKAFADQFLQFIEDYYETEKVSSNIK